MLKQKKGITLVALVVTIIILLILAGVSINMIFGNDGIFSKTQMAAEEYEKAQILEELQMILTLYSIEQKGETDNYNSFKSFVEAKGVEVLSEESDSNYIIIYKKYEAIIDKNSFGIASIVKTNINVSSDGDINTVTISNSTAKLNSNASFTVTSSATTNTISRVELMLGETIVYAESVNNKKNYAKTITFSDLINLDRLNFEETYEIKTKVTLINGKSKEEIGNNIVNMTVGNLQGLQIIQNNINTGVTTYLGEEIVQVADIDLQSINNWEPIGYGDGTKVLKGTYNGNGKAITNLTITNFSGVTGFFGILGYDGTIKNINLYGNVNRNINVGAYAIAGIVGRNEGTIENCVNNANVTVTNNNSYAGGISGVNLRIIKNCTNTGNVSGQTCVGGITSCDVSKEGSVSFITTSNGESYTVISGCTNNGDISGGFCVGGIIGSARENKFENNTNNGEITAQYFVGGIAGWSSVNITNCRNTSSAKVTATTNQSDRNNKSRNRRNCR